MAENAMICSCNEIDYITIRKSMVAGARTLDDVKAMTNAGTICGKCIESIEGILASVCGCNKVSMSDVVNAVKGGAHTVSAVAAETGASDVCGRCSMLVQSIIDERK